MLEKARALRGLGAEELPSALMERLTDEEAQLLSRVAIEREPLQLVTRKLRADAPIDAASSANWTTFSNASTRCGRVR